MLSIHSNNYRALKLFMLAIFLNLYTSCSYDIENAFQVNDMVQEEYRYIFYGVMLSQEYTTTIIYLNFNPDNLKLPFTFQKRDIYALTTKGAKIQLEGLSINGDNLYNTTSIRIDKKGKIMNYDIELDTIPVSENYFFPPNMTVDLPRAPDSLQIALVFNIAKDSIAAIQFNESQICWIKEKNTDILVDTFKTSLVKITGRIISEDGSPKENETVFLVKTPEITTHYDPRFAQEETDKTGEFVIFFDRPTKREYFSLSTEYLNAWYYTQYLKNGEPLYIPIDNKTSIVDLGDILYYYEYRGPQFRFTF